MKVICEIEAIERNSIETPIGEPREIIRVKRHWNNNHLVVLEIGNERYTVIAGDLKQAITACTMMVL